MPSTKRDRAEGSDRAAGGVDAVDRALSILRCFGERDASLTLTEISVRTGLYKSTLLRLTSSLERGGLIVRLGDKSFSIGPEAMRLGAIYQRSFRLEEHVRPVLKALLEATGESASLFRREGDRRVCLFREETSRSLRDHIREGDQLPLGMGAAGHVLARFDPAVHGLEAVKAAIPDLPVRSFGERDPDMAAVAVPVFSMTRAGPMLAGALTLSGPRTRFVGEALTTIDDAIMGFGRALTKSLGGGHILDDVVGKREEISSPRRPVRP